jgi:hypothetical protein
MKILNYVSSKLIIVAIACGFAASTPIQAQQDDARLVVSRSANFGTFQYLILFVDGVHVADLGLNRSYDTVLPPWAACLVGKHDSTDPRVFLRESGIKTRPRRLD